MPSLRVQVLKIIHQFYFSVYMNLSIFITMYNISYVVVDCRSKQCNSCMKCSEYRESRTISSRIIDNNEKKTSTIYRGVRSFTSSVVVVSLRRMIKGKVNVSHDVEICFIFFLNPFCRMNRIFDLHLNFFITAKT